VIETRGFDGDEDLPLAGNRIGEIADSRYGLVGVGGG